MFGKTHIPSEETRIKMSAAKIGKTLSEETKAKISASQPNSHKIQVLDLSKNITLSYASIREAGRALKINQKCISQYFTKNQKKPYKGRYVFKKSGRVGREDLALRAASE